MSARKTKGRSHPPGWLTDDPSWKRWRWEKEAETERPAPRLCSVPGCGRPRHARGWCGRHYRRWWRRLPRPLSPVPVPSPAQVADEMRAAYAECARALEAA
ncbi:hypothetical protein SAMN05443665_100155 [Actinomadura meyerae]|uniref:Uncharacterized protein n=1 Tax=Actinomadura meyerae TaxID=240840 RepID=A0A239BWA8_9ACTN|nr:hypothetical protein [Actinomadura meyerae]SNS11453.1 hypothetical protein SAMN05443665_100155 [Actinomadura meyerae]